MAKGEPIELPHECLQDLVAWLAAENVPGVVIGGVAVSMLSEPRLTRDVDVLIRLDELQWDSFAASASKHRFEPRVSDAVEFARQSRVLLMRHLSDGIPVDVMFCGMAFEEQVIARVQWIEWSGLSIPLPATDDLIVMKAVAHRPRDMTDVAGLIRANPRLKLARAKTLIAEFAEALDAPEIRADFERLAPKPKRRKE